MMEYFLWKLKISKDISKRFLLVILERNIYTILLNNWLKELKQFNMILIFKMMVNIILQFIKKP